MKAKKNFKLHLSPSLDTIKVRTTDYILEDPSVDSLEVQETLEGFPEVLGTREDFLEVQEDFQEASEAREDFREAVEVSAAKRPPDSLEITIWAVE
jgi:hypothetical protein